MKAAITQQEMRRQMKMPFSKAYQIALQSIRVRFWRSMVTAIGIVLGIAFYAFGNSTRLLTPFNPANPDHVESRARLDWLIAMSLAICLVGITNAMLMSVTERYKEIGTMKCLGATDSFIVKIFLIESTMLGFSASLVGTVIGFLLSALVRTIVDGTQVWHRTSGMSIITLCIGSLLIGIVLTVIAAIAPAYRAAKMPAAAALRVEI